MYIPKNVNSVEAKDVLAFFTLLVIARNVCKRKRKP